MVRKTRHCPSCGAVLPGKTYFCSQCCSFIEMGDKSLRDPRWVTDQAIERVLKDSRRKTQEMDDSIRSSFCDWVYRLAALLFLPIFFDFLFPEDSLIPVASAALGGAILFLTYRYISPRFPAGTLKRTPQNLRALGRKFIAPGEVANLLGDGASYDPKGQLAEESIREADGLVRSFYDYRGCEWIQAEYRNVSIEMGHMELTSKIVSRNQDHTVFEGHCLLARTNLDIPKTIQIREKFPEKQYPADDTVPLDFLDIFNVDCEDRSLISQVLTPQREARILDIYEHSPGSIYLLLKSNGTLFIACRDDETRIFLGSKSPDWWRSAYRKALRRPLNILDIFLDKA